MRNQYLRDLRDQMRQRFAEDTEAMSMSDWILRNTTLRKRPFTFEGYEFQQKIVDDMHPNMYVIKPSQVGLTEVQLRKFATFLTRNNGVNGIFSLPDDIMFERVSKTRFKPLLDNDKVFNLGSGVKPIRSIPLYQIGQSYGYFTGAKESDATSINADLLMHDEVDLANQETLALYQSRLQGSKWRITQRFSTPTFEGFGIDAGFQVSDQHEYLCRCSACNHWNLPVFTPDFIHYEGLSSDVSDLTEIDHEMADLIDAGASFVRCEKCGSPLALGDPALREWVARFPGRRVRGYRVSPFSVSHLGPGYILDQLLEYRKKGFLRRFHNTVLGQSFNDSNARLSEVDIRAVMEGPLEPEVDRFTPVVVGIDVGLTCHLVLYHLRTMNPVAFSWRTVLSDNLVHEVKRIIEQFNVVGGLIDRNPYTPLANEVRDLTEKRILPCEYGLPTAPEVTLMRDELDQISHVRINRTTALDAFVTLVRKRQTAFQGYGASEAVIVHHLRQMVRIENPDQPARWEKVSGDDHFFHAGSYGNFAIRVHDAMRYRMDLDMRELADVEPITVSMQRGSGLGMKERRRNPMSIGAL